MKSKQLVIKQRGEHVILLECKKDAEGDIIIPDGVTDIADGVFKRCEKITSVHIPDGVETIGKNAFWGCESLSSINFPDSVMCVGFDIVKGTKWLDNQPNGIVYIGRIAYMYNGTMPNDAKLEIKEGTLVISGKLNCSRARSLTIPSSVTIIENGAFYFENRLETIKIDEANPVYDSRDNCNAIIETSTNCLLYGCKNTIIPKGVIRIEDKAFNGCGGLSSIYLPDTVTSIGKNAFGGCNDLISIEVDQNNPVYDSRNNCNAVLESSTDTLIFGCKATKIPDDTKIIGEYAFYGCKGLKSNGVPEGVVKIDNYAFSGCINLSILFLPHSLKNIGCGAFQDCSRLFNVVFIAVSCIVDDKINVANNAQDEINSGGLECIGDCAFQRCSRLTSIFLPYSLKVIGNHAFKDCSRLQSINIPSGLEKIGDNAFKGTKIYYHSVSIPEGVELGYLPFEYPDLDKIIINEAVMDFCMCHNLTSLAPSLEEVSDFIRELSEEIPDWKEQIKQKYFWHVFWYRCHRSVPIYSIYQDILTSQSKI